MKINEYSKGMRFLTSDQGDYSPNAPDIFVQEKPNYRMPSLEPGFQDGGSVTTPKRGLVDEPGSYAGEHGPYIYEKTSQGGKPIYELEVREQIGGKRKVIRRERLPRTEDNLKILKNIRDTDPKLAKYIKPALYADDDYLKLRLENSDKNQKQFADFLNKETDFRPVNGGKFSERKVKNMDNSTKYVSQTKFRIPESTRANIIKDFKTGKYSMMELGRNYFPDDPVDKFIKGQRVRDILKKESLDTSKFKTKQIDPNKSKYEYQYKRKREITKLLKKAGKKTKEQYFTLENQILAGNEEILKLSDDEILNNKKIMNALNIDASKDNLAKGKITFDKYKNLSPKEQVAKVRELADKRLFIQPEHIRSVYTGQQNIIYPNNLQSAPGKIGSYMENIKEYVRKNPDGKAIPEIEKLFKDYDMGVDEGGKKVGFKNIIYNSEKGSSNIVDSGLFKVLGEKANIKTKPITKPSSVTLGSNFANLNKDLLDFRKLPGDVRNFADIALDAAKSPAALNAARKLKSGLKFTGLGLAGEAAFAAPFALSDYAAGKTGDRILGNATFGLFGETEKEETKKATGDLGYATQTINELQDLIPRIGEQYNLFNNKNDPTFAQRDKFKRIYDINIDKYNKAYNKFVDNEGQFNNELYNQALNNYTAGINQISKFDTMRAEERPDELTGLESYDVGLAGGGLAKLAGKRSGTPPESGPTPQGLDYLLKRGRQY